jgi:hypothetical protein
MPNGPNSVSLDVSDVATPGYTPTTASNGSTYYYKFTGGNTSANNGDVDVSTGQGQAAITVRLNSDSRYSITNISFNPSTSQLSWRGGGNADTAVITDTATTVGTYKYTVTVTDSTAVCTIPCDPQIIHQ